MQLTRVITAASFVAAFVALPRAQSTVDGHWQGSVHVPNQEIAIEIDLAKSTDGAIGTFSGVNITGFPLSNIVVDGASVRFELQVDGGGLFSAKLSADGKSMSGELTTNAGGHVVPFDLSRAGEPRFDAPPTIPAIAKSLEGTWSGTLDVNGVELRIVMKLANEANGRAVGTVTNLDRGAVGIPVSAIAQTDANVTIGVKVVNGTFSGALNAAGTELNGTWTQGSFTAPLVFHRAAR